METQAPTPEARVRVMKIRKPSKPNLVLPSGTIDFMQLAKRLSLFEVTPGSRGPRLCPRTWSHPVPFLEMTAETVAKYRTMSRIVFPSGVVFSDGSFEGPVRLAGHIQSVMLMRTPRLNHEARKRLDFYQSKWWANEPVFEPVEPASIEAPKVEP